MAKITKKGLAMDYKKLAQEIVTNVGDVDNIQTLSHCMTRCDFN